MMDMKSRFPRLLTPFILLWILAGFGLMISVLGMRHSIADKNIIPLDSSSQDFVVVPEGTSSTSVETIPNHVPVPMKAGRNPFQLNSGPNVKTFLPPLPPFDWTAALQSDSSSLSPSTTGKGRKRILYHTTPDKGTATPSDDQGMPRSRLQPQKKPTQRSLRVFSKWEEGVVYSFLVESKCKFYPQDVEYFATMFQKPFLSVKGKFYQVLGEICKALPNGTYTLRQPIPAPLIAPSHTHPRAESVDHDFTSDLSMLAHVSVRVADDQEVLRFPSILVMRDKSDDMASDPVISMHRDDPAVDAQFFAPLPDSAEESMEFSPEENNTPDLREADDQSEVNFTKGLWSDEENVLAEDLVRSSDCKYSEQDIHLLANYLGRSFNGVKSKLQRTRLVLCHLTLNNLWAPRVESSISKTMNADMDSDYAPTKDASASRSAIGKDIQGQEKSTHFLPWTDEEYDVARNLILENHCELSHHDLDWVADRLGRTHTAVRSKLFRLRRTLCEFRDGKWFLVPNRESSVYGSDPHAMVIHQGRVFEPWTRDEVDMAQTFIREHPSRFRAFEVKELALKLGRSENAVLRRLNRLRDTMNSSEVALAPEQQQQVVTHLPVSKVQRRAPLADKSYIFLSQEKAKRRKSASPPQKIHFPQDENEGEAKEKVSLNAVAESSRPSATDLPKASEEGHKGMQKAQTATIPEVSKTAPFNLMELKLLATYLITKACRYTPTDTEFLGSHMSRSQGQVVRHLETLRRILCPPASSTVVGSGGVVLDTASRPLSPAPNTDRVHHHL